MADPGGFPGTVGPPPPGRPDDHLPRRGLESTGRIDPWGEQGPRDQTEADVPLDERQRAALLTFPTYGDPALQAVEFTEAYARLAASLVAQLAFVDELIAAEYQRDGVAAFRIESQESVVVGSGEGASVELVPTGTQTMTALLAWQGQLQTRVAKVLGDGIRWGIKAAQADLVRRYGEWVATALQSFSRELGVDWDDRATRRAAQRAVLRTRETLQLGATSPDAAGPELTDEERARIGVQR